MPKLFSKARPWRETGLIWLWLSIAMLALDQITKFVIVQSFQLYEVVSITSFFNVVRVHNHGAAFSFLSDAGGWQRWFFTGIAVVISALLCWWMYQASRQQRMLSCAYALVLSGAIGNVLDRFEYGYVVDFLDFYYGNYHWPAFNVADSAICVGAILLAIDAIFFSHKREAKLDK